MLCYEQRFPFEQCTFHSVQGMAAGILVLARRAHVQDHELNAHVALTLLWILEAWDTQYYTALPCICQRYAAMIPNARERSTASELLSHTLKELQIPLLQRCNWKIRMDVSDGGGGGGELGECLWELRKVGGRGFYAFCNRIESEAALVKKRIPLVSKNSDGGSGASGTDGSENEPKKKKQKKNKMWLGEYSISSTSDDSSSGEDKEEEDEVVVFVERSPVDRRGHNAQARAVSRATCHYDNESIDVQDIVSKKRRGIHAMYADE